MKDSMEDAWRIHNPEEVGRRGVPKHGSCAEFSLTFVKLLYARVILGREMDFRRLSGSGQTPRKRGRDDRSASPSPSSALAIVPTGEGSLRQLPQTLDEVFAEAESSLALEEATPAEVLSWYRPVAGLSWKRSVFCTRELGSLPWRRLEDAARSETEVLMQEIDDMKNELQRLLEFADNVDGVDRESLLRAELGVVRVQLDEALLQTQRLSRECLEKEAELHIAMNENDRLEREVYKMREDALTLSRLGLVGHVPAPGSRQLAPEAPGRLEQLEKELKESVDGTAKMRAALEQQLKESHHEVEALKKNVTELQNAFVEEVAHQEELGALKSVWEIETAELKEAVGTAQARVLEDSLVSTEFPYTYRASIKDKLPKTRELLHGRCVAEFDSTTEAARSPSGLRQKFHALKRVELELQTERADLDAAAQGVSWKFRTKHHDLKNMQCDNLKILVYRGKKTMWPQPARDRWNEGGSVVRQAFPGWVTLPMTEGGTKNLPPMWHRAQCYVCQNFFGPEGGYVPGTCAHPVHISCLLRMLHKCTKCGICRKEYHPRLWFQFSLEDKLPAARQSLEPRFYMYKFNLMHVTGITSVLDGPAR
ncbi:hypothetical protein R1sor_013998 [Riccia sorocarpa]|uniref:RING-type domain-containing protein n=1 Tax=Riccia sorocarpa TaxID=122646 RepID=A0ABD3HB17_9MARC